MRNRRRGLSTRKTALSIGTPRTERGEISVQIPAGWKVSYVPPKLEGKAEGLRCCVGLRGCRSDHYVQRRDQARQARRANR